MPQSLSRPVRRNEKSSSTSACRISSSRRWASGLMLSTATGWLPDCMILAQVMDSKFCARLKMRSHITAGSTPRQPHGPSGSSAWNCHAMTSESAPLAFSAPRGCFRDMGGIILCDGRFLDITRRQGKGFRSIRPWNQALSPHCRTRRPGTRCGRSSTGLPCG